MTYASPVFKVGVYCKIVVALGFFLASCPLHGVRIPDISTSPWSSLFGWQSTSRALEPSMSMQSSASQVMDMGLLSWVTAHLALSMFSHENRKY